MEYYPSSHDVQMHKFFQRRKTALIRLNKLGLNMPYISEYLTHEQLLNNWHLYTIYHKRTWFLNEARNSLFFVNPDLLPNGRLPKIKDLIIE